MNEFEEILEKNLHELFEPAEFMTKLLQKEFRQKRNVDLTKDQIVQLKMLLKKIINQRDIPSVLQIEINDDKSIQITESSNTSDQIINIGILANKEIDKINKGIPNLIEECSEMGSKLLLQNFKKHNKNNLLKHRKEQALFNKGLYSNWGVAINLLESFVLLIQEIGCEYNEYIQQIENDDITPKFEILRRSHARSCQVALEIVTLLKNGFADGAHARWRTLHEIAVETNIIQKNDDDLAVSYLDHLQIQDYKSAKIFQQHCLKLHYEPFSLEEMEKITESYNDLIINYGKNYSSEYGWATKIIKGKVPKFCDLESIAEFEHMRPFYKLSCMNVHGGPKGLIYRLGLTDEQQRNILLAGPSTNGLGDPIQNVAYSLLQITCALLNYEINLDYLIELKVLKKIEEEIFQLVDQIENV